MKKLLISLIVLCFALPAYGGESIHCSDLRISGYVLGASEALTIDVSQGSDGFFCIQPTFTGTGTLKIEYQVSTLGNYWSPVAVIIAGAVSSTVYPYPASGTNIFAGRQRIIITETGGANSVTFQELGRCSQ